jgi:hypothetical protein
MVPGGSRKSLPKRKVRFADQPPGTRKELAEQKPALETCFALKSSTETEATLMFVNDHALLNHAITGSGRDMAAFFAGPIRP